MKNKKETEEIHEKWKGERTFGENEYVCETFLLVHTDLMCFFLAEKCYYYHGSIKTKHVHIQLICSEIYALFLFMMKISINVLNAKMFITGATCYSTSLLFHIFSRAMFCYIFDGFQVISNKNRI